VQVSRSVLHAQSAECRCRWQHGTSKGSIHILLYKIREPDRAVRMESWSQCQSCGGHFGAFVADTHVAAVIMVRFCRCGWSLKASRLKDLSTKSHDFQSEGMGPRKLTSQFVPIGHVQYQPHDCIQHNTTNYFFKYK